MNLLNGGKRTGRQVLERAQFQLLVSSFPHSIDSYSRLCDACANLRDAYYLIDNLLSSAPAPDHPDTVCVDCGRDCRGLVCCDSGYRLERGLAVHDDPYCFGCCPTAHRALARTLEAQDG